jgi:hypothetical protein
MTADIDGTLANADPERVASALPIRTDLRDAAIIETHVEAVRAIALV